ncbi:MAG: hypothetical protein ABI147_14285 [Acidobacteriaceae bacterium]
MTEKKNKRNDLFAAAMPDRRVWVAVCPWGEIVTEALKPPLSMRRDPRSGAWNDRPTVFSGWRQFWVPFSDEF